MDIASAVVDLVFDKLKQSATAAWLKFLFELGFSAVVSFLFICGGVLVSSRSVSLSVGSGMIASAISLTVLFRKESAKLTKGMMVVLPADEATKELETNLQTIQKEK